MSSRVKKGKSTRSKALVTSGTERARSQEHSSSRTHTTSQIESIPSTTNGSASEPEVIPSSSNRGTQSVSHEGNNEGATSKRRGRGRAKPWKGWGKQKLILNWNELCQPFGEHKENLATQLGYFARQGSLFPLTLSSWREADEGHLKVVWSSIQENTNAPNGFEEICITKIGESWRKFKNQLKNTHYKKFKTDEERLAHVPTGVETGQWRKLVALWGTSDSQRVAAQNTENRAHLSCYYRMGKKSYAEIKEEMKAKNLPTDNLSVYIHTRKMDEGARQDDGSAEKHEMIQRQLEELSPEERNDGEIRDKIFNEVVGEDGHGRALCMGVGIAPRSKRSKTYFSSSQHNDEITRVRQEAEERETRHKEELAMVRVEMNEMLKQNSEFFINILRGAGISIPDNTPWIDVGTVVDLEPARIEDPTLSIARLPCPVHGQHGFDHLVSHGSDHK